MRVLTLGEIAVRYGCELRGDPDRQVDHVATLAEAGARALAFAANAKYLGELLQTKAAAVIVNPSAVASCPVAALVTPNPHALFARVASELHPAPSLAPGVHASAIVAASASVDPSASVGALAVIGERVRLSARCVVGPAAVVEDDAVIGADTRLASRVTVCHGVRIGARCIVHAGAVIGADGFGFAEDKGAWVKVPQVGTVIIGDDVDIGANTTIDRGAIGDTVIGDDVKLDNLIQVGHNVRIGAHTAIAACSGVSGSTIIGERCRIGGMVGFVGHQTICDDVAVTGLTMVSHSITQPGIYSGGIPAEPARDWRRIVARVKRLDAMARRLAALEQTLGVRAAGDVSQGEDGD